MAATKPSTFRRTVFNAGCRSGQTIALNIISVPATAYIIRKLGATEYGEWSTAVGLMATVGVITNLGLRGRFVRSVAQRPDSASQIMADQLGARIVLAALAGGVMLLAAWLLRYPPIVIECTALAAASVLCTTVFTTMSDMFEAFQRFPIVAFASFVAGLVLTASSVAVIALGGGPVALSVSYLGGPVLSAAVLLVVLRRERFRVSARFHPLRTARLLWESRHFAVQQLLGNLSSNVPMLVLPKMVGTAPFGLFSAGMLLITRLVVFPDALGTAFYPMIAELFPRDVGSARRQTMRGLMLAFVLCCGVAAVTTVVAGPIAQILMPKSPEVCRHVIIFTSWALPFMGLESMIGYALNAAGREADQARVSLLGACINVTLGASLIFAAGTSGACAYVVLRSAVQATVRMPIFVRAFYPRNLSTDDADPLSTLSKTRASVEHSGLSLE